MGRLAPTRRARVTSVLALLLALLLLWHCPDLARTASYLGVLAGSFGVLGAAAAVRLWQGCRCAAPATTLSVASAVLVGLLLDLFVGLPGVSVVHGHPGATTFVLLALGSAVVFLVPTVGLLVPDPPATGPSRLAP